jgi:hypothetical protein
LYSYVSGRKTTSLPLDDNSETFPYYFIADEAVPLKINITRPYPGRMLTNERCIPNHRLVPEKV